MTSQIGPQLERQEREPLAARPLTREQQLLLWQKWSLEGNARARDRLIRASQKHIGRIAAHYREFELPFSRLVCEGNQAIPVALKNYDSRRGARFVTYAAYWIRARMLRYILGTYGQSGIDRSPSNYQLLLRLRRERARMEALIGRDDPSIEFANLTSKSRFRSANESRRRPVATNLTGE
jgi:RNA polymerase sigma-32 factor